MNNMEVWDKLKRPPTSALKTIKGGRLNGMTDISPQWRYQIMTEVFGQCGVGWRYSIERTWTEPGSEGQLMAFAEVLVHTKDGEDWSAGVPGIGGSTLVTLESKGLHTSDEGFKMAITDALSTALKMIGVGADIYAGKFDGTKYADEEKPKTTLKTKGMSPELSAEIVKAGMELGEGWQGRVKMWYVAKFDVQDSSALSEEQGKKLLTAIKNGLKE